MSLWLRGRKPRNGEIARLAGRPVEEERVAWIVGPEQGAESLLKTAPEEHRPSIVLLLPAAEIAIVVTFFITLRVFLLLAEGEPIRYRLGIDFAACHSLAHSATMLILTIERTGTELRLQRCGHRRSDRNSCATDCPIEKRVGSYRAVHKLSPNLGVM